MGIRYYGWAVTSDEADRALTDPWPVIAEADRRYGGDDLLSVDLDKSWHLLQGLFRPDWPREPRPAYALIAGNVTYPLGYDHGYEPHVGVLSHQQVRLIAGDLTTVGATDLRSYCAGLCYDEEERRRSDYEYLSHHLRSAQTFTADVVEHGLGIVYMIG